MKHDKQEIVVGDIVYLVSGSPELKVTSIDVSVEWKDTDGETHTGVFPLESLTLQATPE